MLQALADGETDAAVLAAMAHQRLRATQPQLCDALGAAAELNSTYRQPAAIVDGRVFRCVNRSGRAWGSGITEKGDLARCEGRCGGRPYRKTVTSRLPPYMRPAMSRGWWRTGTDPVPVRSRLRRNDRAIPWLQTAATRRGERPDRPGAVDGTGRGGFSPETPLDRPDHPAAKTATTTGRSSSPPECTPSFIGHRREVALEPVSRAVIPGLASSRGAGSTLGRGDGKVPSQTYLKFPDQPHSVMRRTGYPRMVTVRPVSRST